MRTIAIVVFTAALLTGGVARAETDEDRISTRQTGEDSFEITLESKSVFDVPSATLRIAPTAVELCGGHYIEPGRYTFDMNQAVTGSDSEDWFRLVQNIRCVDSLPQRPQSDRTPQLEDEAAAEAVRSKVRQLSEDYFGRVYAQMGDDASAALAAMGGGEDADSSAIFATAADTPVSIDLFRVTVYDNLPSAPADGVYVAVDYDNRVGNVAHHCGYLMWHTADVEEFTLGRVESGILDDGLLESMSGDEVYAVRKQLRCANVYDDQVSSGDERR